MFQTIPECFKFPLFSILGLCESGSMGLSLNSLPKLNLDTFTSLVDEDNFNAKQLLKTLEQEAVLEFINELYSALSESIILNHVWDSVSVMEPSTEKAKWLMINEPIGLKIIADKRDKFTRTNIKTISFYSDSYREVEYKIVDGTKEILKTFIMLEGKNVLEIDYTTDSKEFYVWFAFCGIKLKVDSCVHTNFCGCNNCANIYAVQNKVSDLKDRVCECAISSNPFGFCVNCICDLTPIICNFIQFYGSVLRLKVGIKLLHYLKVSGNINPVVQNSDEDIQFLLTLWTGGIDKFTGKIIEGEYSKLFRSVIKIMKGSINNISSPCIKCKSNFNIISNLP